MYVTYFPLIHCNNFHNIGFDIKTVWYFPVIFVLSFLIFILVFARDSGVVRSRLS